MELFDTKLFGTDGIRTLVGNYPLNLDISKLAHVISTWINQKKFKRILIAHDTRNSCYWIKSELKSKLLLYPTKIYDHEILPTPVAFHLVSKKKKFDIGIIITASHNPFYDNGIKIITQNGKLSLQEEQEIESLFSQNLYNESFPKSLESLDTLGTSARGELVESIRARVNTPLQKKSNEISFQNLGTETYTNSECEKYILDLVKILKKDFLRGKKIVLDCANGATQVLAPKIFSLFGPELVVINNRSNGFNINNKCGSTNVTKLQKIVLKNRADFGIAFDGDGDRAVIINKYGQIKDGDDLLVLLSEHPDYKKEKAIVGTQMSNGAIAKYFCKRFIRSNVGDKNVLDKMIETESLLGAEPSGHIILRDFLDCSDGIYASLKTLESAVLTNNLDLETIKKYPSINKNIRIKYRCDLSENPVNSIIEKYRKKVERIVVRYSGTEPLLRVLVEDKNFENANKIGNKLMEELNSLF